ncbi:hypothetical protein MC885_020912 [Smutsia gigantea]|nr:hypothetical protein MC885_020912 [Smutsia gigantea]
MAIFTKCNMLKFGKKITFLLYSMTVISYNKDESTAKIFTTCTGPCLSWYSTPSLPFPISLPKERRMTLMQQVVPVGNWHIFSLLELLFLPLDFLLFLLVWL